MRILVTGGAGFIGSHLVAWLLNQGHHVRVLDNFSTSNAAVLADWRTDIEVLSGDIRDFATVRAAVREVEAVIHLAALVAVDQSVREPLLAQAINVMGSLHVLEAARQEGVRRVVQASSCAVYGNTTQFPVREDAAPQPLSPYAATKLAAEQMGQLYTTLYGVETVALRFFNVYGPRQDPASPYAAVVPRFLAALGAGQQPLIYGDGLQSRDFIYVGDIVRALWIATSTPGLGGAVFNVGSGRSWSILELAQLLGEVLGVAVQPHFAPARSGEVRHSCADVSYFAARAGFRSTVDLRAGLLATLALHERALGD